MSNQCIIRPASQKQYSTGASVCIFFPFTTYLIMPCTCLDDSGIHVWTGSNVYIVENTHVTLSVRGASNQLRLRRRVGTQTRINNTIKRSTAVSNRLCCFLRVTLEYYNPHHNTNGYFTHMPGRPQLILPTLSPCIVQSSHLVYPPDAGVPTPRRRP